MADGSLHLLPTGRKGGRILTIMATCYYIGNVTLYLYLMFKILNDRKESPDEIEDERQDIMGVNSGITPLKKKSEKRAKMLRKRRKASMHSQLR